MTGQPKTDTDSLPDKVRRWLKTDALPKPQPFKYVIQWESAFELSEVDQKQADLLHEQANEVRLKYMTIDEVRAMNELKSLPDGQGAKLQTQQPFQFEEQKPPVEGDKKYTVIEHASHQTNPDSKGS